MNYAEQLAKAIEIATVCHAGQFDKNNKPYILHPLRVMFKMEFKDDKITAVLHDVVEDCSAKLCNELYYDEISNYILNGGESPVGTRQALLALELAGFDKDIITVVDLLSKDRSFSSKEYIDRIKSNKSAIRVKLADLEDNMDYKRLPECTIEDWERFKKYRDLWSHLKAVLWVKI